ncbi:MAG: energy transducer TonB [Burkholderiaceae bacterium]
MKFLKTLSALQIALLFSVGVHAVVLSVRFVDPESFNRVFQDSPLEVILVNAKSSEKPDQAKAIAQSSLAGGGDADKGRATTPLPPSALSALGDSADDEQRKVEALQAQQTILLTQLKKQLAALPPPDPKQASDNPEAQAREDKRRQLIKLLAEIERRINEENARPKKRYISPATKAGVHAIYYAAVKEKIEELGTRNFPVVAGRKLYGELTMLISLDRQGRVVSTEIVESSGSKALDRLAQAIVRAGEPYGNFTSAMRREFQIMVMASRFKFTRDEGLQTQSTTINRPAPAADSLPQQERKNP